MYVAMNTIYLEKKKKKKNGQITGEACYTYTHTLTHLHTLTHVMRQITRMRRINYTSIKRSTAKSIDRKPNLHIVRFPELRMAEEEEEDF